MALDIDRLAETMVDEAIDELVDEYGEENIDESAARKGLRPMAKAFARAIIEEFQDHGVVTVTGVAAGIDTANGSIA